MTAEDDKIDFFEDVERASPTEHGLAWLASVTEEPDPSDAEEPAPEGKAWTDFVASTGSVDRHGDSIDQQTWKLRNWKANPVIPYEHGATVVGAGVPSKTRAVEVAGVKTLRTRVVWDNSPLNPLGQLMAHQYANKIRRAVSVGFIPGEVKSRTELPPEHPLYVDPEKTSRWMAGYLFRHPELLEISAVAVPANSEAIALALSTVRAENADASVERYLGESMTRAAKSAVLDAIRNDREIRKSLLALILSDARTSTVRQPEPDRIDWME